MNWRAFLVIDFKDASNWIALGIAIPVLVWGIMMLVRAI